MSERFIFQVIFIVTISELQYDRCGQNVLLEARFGMRTLTSEYHPIYFVKLIQHTLTVSTPSALKNGKKIPVIQRTGPQFSVHVNKEVGVPGHVQPHFATLHSRYSKL